jgi:hypothetical protein
MFLNTPKGVKRGGNPLRSPPRGLTEKEGVTKPVQKGVTKPVQHTRAGAFGARVQEYADGPTPPTGGEEMTTQKRGRGRPRIELGEEEIQQVEKLAAYLNQAQIADVLGISERTLRDRIATDEAFFAAYKRGRARAIAEVAQSLINTARNGSVPAAIFYLKTQAGWRDTSRVELEHSSTLPMSISVTFDGSASD